MYAWAYLVSTNTIASYYNHLEFINLGGKNLCRGSSLNAALIVCLFDF